MAERKLDESLTGGVPRNLFKIDWQKYAPPQPTRTERIVSEASWRVGYAAGQAFSWAKYAARNVTEGFRAAQD